MEKITSTQNSQVKYVTALKDASTRRAEGRFVVEGHKMLSAALSAGLIPETVFVREDFLGDPGGVQAAPCFAVTDAVFQKMSDVKTPQGVLAVFCEPRFPLTPPTENCLILDAVRDPGNVGAILRTAAACGMADIYLLNCADAFCPKSVRASMSGIFFVRIHEATAEDVKRLIAPHAALWTADMGGEDIFSLRTCRAEPTALIIGNEAHGVSADLRAMADRTVRLPMQHIESLNAAVSASILMYHLTYHRNNSTEIINY